MMAVAQPFPPKTFWLKTNLQVSHIRLVPIVIIPCLHFLARPTLLLRTMRKQIPPKRLYSSKVRGTVAQDTAILRMSGLTEVHYT